MPRGTPRTPFPEVLVVFATPRFPEEYDLVFPEVPTTPRSPEKDLFLKSFPLLFKNNALKRSINK